MASISIDSGKQTRSTTWIILIFITLIVMLISAHAVSRHGQDALMADQACQESPIITLKNPETCRSATVGKTDDGRFAIRIDDPSGQCITCFIKEKLKEFGQVIRYLTNRGYR